MNSPTKVALVTGAGTGIGKQVAIALLREPGQEEVAEVKLLTRRQGTHPWQSSAATHAGRSVYTARLGPSEAADGTIEYYATAPGRSQLLCDPPQASGNFYTLNILA
jgi:NAD(P)-dependent dehydrogenase (short-subunit alcohol dehydrogenase family)